MPVNSQSAGVKEKKGCNVIKSKNDGPLDYGWLPLGAGKGIKWTLWQTNVVLARQEKQGDQWLTTEEIHLAPKILKEIHWRLVHWLATIENGGVATK